MPRKPQVGANDLAGNTTNPMAISAAPVDRSRASLAPRIATGGAGRAAPEASSPDSPPFLVATRPE